MFVRKSLITQTNLTWGICYWKVQYNTFFCLSSSFPLWKLPSSWFSWNCILCSFASQAEECVQGWPKCLLQTQQLLPQSLNEENKVVLCSLGMLALRTTYEAKADESKSERWRENKKWERFLMTFESLKTTTSLEFTLYVSQKLFFLS